jgi:predicted oxidoreductase (fatty acid repression mutant protein)
MADKFLEVVEARKSLYKLKAESTIPDSKIQEIVEATIKHAPSTYNVQSARAVILLGAKHQQLWDIAIKHMEPALEGSPMKDHVVSRIALHRASYGTVLWYEDQDALKALGEKSPMIVPMLTECEYQKLGAVVGELTN